MIQVFEHSNDTSAPVKLIGSRSPADRITDVIDIEVDELIFVESRDEPLDVTMRLEVLVHDQAVHLHRHRRSKIATVVAYNGQEVQHEFSPATLLATVRDVSVKHLQLDAASATDLELRLPCAAESLDESTHLGSLAADDCEVVHLVLLPGDRFHG